jgi:hypothetical protein
MTSLARFRPTLRRGTNPNESPIARMRRDPFGGWVRHVEYAAFLKRLSRLADDMDAFQPRGELGPLHGAGMAFAYKDAAKTIRALLQTDTSIVALPDGGDINKETK